MNQWNLLKKPKRQNRNQTRKPENRPPNPTLSFFVPTSWEKLFNLVCSSLKSQLLIAANPKPSRQNSKIMANEMQIVEKTLERANFYWLFSLDLLVLFKATDFLLFLTKFDVFWRSLQTLQTLNQESNPKQTYQKSTATIVVLPRSFRIYSLFS